MGHKTRIGELAALTAIIATTGELMGLLTQHLLTLQSLIISIYSVFVCLCVCLFVCLSVCLLCWPMLQLPHHCIIHSTANWRRQRELNRVSMMQQGFDDATRHWWCNEALMMRPPFQSHVGHHHRHHHHHHHHGRTAMLRVSLCVDILETSTCFSTNVSHRHRRQLLRNIKT